VCNDEAGCLSILFMVVLLAAGVIAEAQQQSKVPKIGWLDSGPTVRDTRLGEVFVRRLRELGYVEGKNITIEYRSANDKLDRLRTLAGELVRLNVDVLVTSTTPAAIAAKNATKTISIVFILLAADPVAAGLIDSLARPGGNITGLTNIAAELGGKRWSCSRKPFPSSRALRCCGIHRIQAPCKHGKKANGRHENWACSFIPWK
jgi:putative tryptophan/tyrosine transport system substrate-binding protein